MWEFYNKIFLATGGHLVVLPADQRRWYRHHYPSYIVLGDNRHWRSTSHVTHSFLTHSMIVEKYWDYFDNTKYCGDRIRIRRRRSAMARTINKVFKHIPGFSPIPSLACHLQSSRTISPFFDWQKLWSQYKSDERY